MVDIEEKSLTDIISHDPKVLRTIQLGLRQLSGFKTSIIKLRDKIDKIKNDAVGAEKNLIANLPNEVDKAYQNYKNLPIFIKSQVTAASKKFQFSGTPNATKPHPFLDFIGLTSDLIFCLLIRNDIYRYPHPDYQNENLEMLNRPEMKEPCERLIEIMLVGIKTIRPLMKTSKLAF